MVCGCQYGAMWLYVHGIGSMICARHGYDSVGCGHVCGQGCACLSVLLDLWGEDDLEYMLFPRETEVGKRGNLVLAVSIGAIVSGQCGCCRHQCEGKKEGLSEKE